jgi:hypothetical protein
METLFGLRPISSGRVLIDGGRSASAVHGTPSGLGSPFSPRIGAAQVSSAWGSVTDNTIIANLLSYVKKTAAAA